MFLFRHGSLRQKMAQSVFALCVLACLFAALLFTGCKTEPDEDFSYELNENLIGIWRSTYDDAYTITATHLSYGYGADTISYAGTIRHATAFSSTAGVIIFEYDAAHKPAYYEGYDPVTYEPIGDPLPLKGNFIAVYYQDLISGTSVKMGTAYAEGGAEEPTLSAAIQAFTVHKEGDYMGYYGTYLKLP